KPAVPTPGTGDDALAHPEVSGTSVERIANHLMRRIRHGQLWKRVEVARSLELLVPIPVSVNGYSLRRYIVARDHGLSGKPIADLAVLRRMFLSGRRAIGQEQEIPGEGLTSAGNADGLAEEGCGHLEWPYLLALLDGLPSVDETANLAVV